MAKTRLNYRFNSGFSQMPEVTHKELMTKMPSHVTSPRGIQVADHDAESRDVEGDGRQDT
jgi:hypothetical protein